MDFFKEFYFDDFSLDFYKISDDEDEDIITQKFLQLKSDSDLFQQISSYVNDEKNIDLLNLIIKQISEPPFLSLVDFFQSNLFFIFLNQLKSSDIPDDRALSILNCIFYSMHDDIKNVISFFSDESLPLSFFHVFMSFYKRSQLSPLEKLNSPFFLLFLKTLRVIFKNSDVGPSFALSLICIDQSEMFRLICSDAKTCKTPQNFSLLIPIFNFFSLIKYILFSYHNQNDVDNISDIDQAKSYSSLGYAISSISQLIPIAIDNIKEKPAARFLCRYLRNQFCKSIAENSKQNTELIKKILEALDEADSETLSYIFVCMELLPIESTQILKNEDFLSDLSFHLIHIENEYLSPILSFIDYFSEDFFSSFEAFDIPRTLVKTYPDRNQRMKAKIVILSLHFILIFLNERDEDPETYNEFPDWIEPAFYQALDVFEVSSYKQQKIEIQLISSICEISCNYFISIAETINFEEILVNCLEESINEDFSHLIQSFLHTFYDHSQ